jgi:ubiquinone/menaquinone biosynthesis C-methylase UbiE
LEIPAAGDPGILKMTIEGFTISNRVYVPDRIRPDTLFEQNYTSLRWKENRMYGDEEVSRLPDIPDNHPHHKEWQLRSQSCVRLIRYLERKEKPLRILEIGCGNGWLSRQLVTIPKTKVIGQDINFTELQQAARVFHDVPNLHFLYGDIQSGLFEENHFDIIVFAACIQYFPRFREIITYCQGLINKSGEIHILDSPFYKPEELENARQRTQLYYREIGFKQMASQYFHHTLADLHDIPYQVVYRPTLVGRYLLGNSNPFPWIVIPQKSMPA